MDDIIHWLHAPSLLDILDNPDLGKNRSGCICGRTSRILGPTQDRRCHSNGFNIFSRKPTRVVLRS